MRPLGFCILRGDAERAAAQGREMSCPLVGQPWGSAEHLVASLSTPSRTMAGRKASGMTEIAWASSMVLSTLIRVLVGY